MTEKELVLKAIKDGEYEVEIEEPNNVRYCERYDGTPFYIMVGDDIKFGVWAGACSVTVRDHRFTCDLNYGDWSGDDDLLDQELIDALEAIDGVLCGEHLETDAQWEVYAAANGITEKIPYFWCEDDERFKDVERLDWYDEYITFHYAAEGEEEWHELEACVNCQDVYDVYKALKENSPTELESGSDIILGGDEIKAASEDLFMALLEAVGDELPDTEGVRLRLNASKAFFDSVL